MPSIHSILKTSTPPVNATNSGIPQLPMPGTTYAYNTGNKKTGASQQAAALDAPVSVPPATIKATQNPAITNVQNRYNTYLDSLAKNADQFNTDSLAAQRDVNTGMEKEAVSDAARRGFSSDTGISQGQQAKAAYQGAKNLAALNAANTNSARAQQANVLAGATGAATAGANDILGQENAALNQAKFQQDTNNFYAQLQAMQNQNQFNNTLQLLNMFSGGF